MQRRWDRKVDSSAAQSWNSPGTDSDIPPVLQCESADTSILQGFHRHVQQEAVPKVTLKKFFSDEEVEKPSSAKHDGDIDKQLLMFKEKDGNRLHAATTVKWEKLTLLVDSGASDTVVPQDLCPLAKIQWTNKVGVEYEIVDGGTLENLGERRCLLKTAEDEDDSTAFMMAFQVVDVNKASSAVMAGPISHPEAASRGGDRR